MLIRFFSLTYTFGHNKEFIYKKRGFDNIEDHNRVLVENWNNKVTNNDTVFLLGDTIVGCGKDSLDTFHWLLTTLNYKDIYLMSGNHEAGWHQTLKSYNNNHLGDFVFGGGKYQVDNHIKSVYLIPNYFEIMVGRQHIVMCHYPILSFNHMNDGSWLLFGHQHQNQSVGVKPPNKSLEVTPESIGMQPISINEIKIIMNNKPLNMMHHSI